ncbi:hypothetical protein AX16_010793 [Volvariella volvacea WC 439]|nr:hypothetical protein AX16_010793 [Volvariella volvacea WC 439]
MSFDPRIIQNRFLVNDTDSDSGTDRNRERDLFRGRDAFARRQSVHTANPNLITANPTHNLNLLAGRRSSWAPALPPRPSSASAMSSGSSPSRSGHRNGNGNGANGRSGRRSSNNSPGPMDRVRRGSRGHGGAKRRMSHSHSSSTPRTKAQIVPSEGSGYGSGQDSSGPPTPSLPAFQLNYPSSSNLLIRRASNLSNLAAALPPDPSSHHHPLHPHHHHYHPQQPSNLQSHNLGPSNSGDAHAPGLPTSIAAGEPSPPEDGGNFKKSLQIDMKGLVGDAVGNMSISPSSRDVVLAARRGLFIIDLEAPLEVPRFLPQGGTWDVADVQWNPHSARAEYIVSTSSEKLLVWNLLLNPKSKTSIEHILHAHYRAVTDTNWHTTECDVVVSTGIDSWVWGWDLRVGEVSNSVNNAGRGGRRPVFGLSAFNSAGTQVRWNRVNADILASSHSNEVLIWDRRKGSLPLLRLPAHSSKIYGIDWSHTAPNELVTCSLDKTIKVWDINVLPSTSSGSLLSATPFTNSTFTTFTAASSATMNCRFANTDVPGLPEPKIVVNTRYPVWRARNLPFGKGILSLAQRGETALEMYARSGFAGDETLDPVERFEGHTDVVKEFVWRRAPGLGLDGSEYQLITWSKDRTLRFWPIDSDLMQRVGYVPPRSALASPQTPTASALTQSSISFRSPPTGTAYPSIHSGPRSILDEVRPPWPPTPGTNALQPTNTSSPFPVPSIAQRQAANLVMQPHIGSAARGSVLEQMMSAAISKTADPRDHPIGGAATVTAVGGIEGPRAAITSGSGGAGETMVPVAGSQHQGGTMSRGGMGVATRLDPFTWLSNVKVGVTQPSQISEEVEGELAVGGDESEVGTITGGSTMSLVRHMPRPSFSMARTTTVASRVSSREGSGSLLGRGRNEASGSRGAEDRKDKEKEKEETGQTLQDEITSVLKKLSSSKIKLEKHDLLRKRTCTLGLHGPWGENSSVFIRVTFTFPRGYPHAEHPHGTPTVDIERNPLISIQKRAFISRRLRLIREKKRPCLEACLRFLLFASEEEENEQGEDSSSGDELTGRRRRSISSDDDDDDDRLAGRKDFTVSLLRNNKNLAEPRTSQGTFGPNGELVCFFRAPPRFVGSVLRGVHDSLERPSTESEVSTTTTTPAEGATPAGGTVSALPYPPPPSSISSTTSAYEMSMASRPLQPPALVTDAIRRLSMVAKDRTAKPGEPRKADQGENMTRVMTNFLTFSKIGGLGRGLDLQLGKGTETPPVDRPGMDGNYFGANDVEQLGVGLSAAVGGIGTGIGINGSIIFPSGSSIRSGKRQSIIGTEIVQSGKSYLLPTRRSTVFITRTADIAGADRKVAVEYVSMLEEDEGGLVEVCERNLKVSQNYGRYDHERVWMILKTLFEVKKGHEKGLSEKVNAKLKKRRDHDIMMGFMENEIGMKIVVKLLEDFAKCKDIQMLAMLSTILLQAVALCPSPHFKDYPNPNSKRRKILQHFSQPSRTITTSPRTKKAPRDLSKADAGVKSPIPPSKPLPGTLVNLPSLPKNSRMDYFTISRAINGQVIPDSSNLTLPTSLFHQTPAPTTQPNLGQRRAMGSASHGTQKPGGNYHKNHQSYSSYSSSSTLVPTPTQPSFPPYVQGQGHAPGVYGPPPPPPPPPVIAPSNSSKASWSSLFGAGAGTVRNLMGTLTTTTTPTSEVPPGTGENDAGGGYFAAVAAHLTGEGPSVGASSKSTVGRGTVGITETDRSGGTLHPSMGPGIAPIVPTKGGASRRGKGLARTGSMIGLAFSRSSDGREASTSSTGTSSTVVSSTGTGSTISTTGSSNESADPLSHVKMGGGVPVIGTGAHGGPIVFGHHGGRKRREGAQNNQGANRADGITTDVVDRGSPVSNESPGGSGTGSASTSAGAILGSGGSGQAKPGTTHGSRSWSEVVNGKGPKSAHGHGQGQAGYAHRPVDPRSSDPVSNVPPSQSGHQRKGHRGNSQAVQTSSPVPPSQQFQAPKMGGIMHKGTSGAGAKAHTSNTTNAKGVSKVRLQLQSPSRNPPQNNKALFFDSPSYREKNEALAMTTGRQLFSLEQIRQFISHVYVYAEMLFSWQLYQKRVELLKSMWRVLSVLKREGFCVNLVDELGAEINSEDIGQSHLFGAPFTNMFKMWSPASRTRWCLYHLLIAKCDGTLLHLSSSCERLVEELLQV